MVSGDRGDLYTLDPTAVCDEHESPEGESRRAISISGVKVSCALQYGFPSCSCTMIASGSTTIAASWGRCPRGLGGMETVEVMASEAETGGWARSGEGEETLKS